MQAAQLPSDIVFKTYCSAGPKPGNIFYAYGNNYQRAGIPIVLQPDSVYYAKFPEAPEKVFQHHIFCLISSWRKNTMEKRLQAAPDRILGRNLHSVAS